MLPILVRGKALKVKIERDKTDSILREFNDKHIAKKTKWFEFDFINNDIIIEEVDY